MSMRFCPKCDQEVEASGGYCLLGHRLSLTPPVASITELRDEVDRAFEGSELEVAAVASPAPAAPIVSASTASASTVSVAAAPANAVSPQGSVEAAVRPRRTGPPPPPPPRRPKRATVSVDAGPGPVPTAEEIVARKSNVWKKLEDDVDLAGDPISAFAPPPSMDWGPRESKLRRKPSRTLGRFKRNKAEDTPS